MSGTTSLYRFMSRWRLNGSTRLQFFNIDSLVNVFSVPKVSSRSFSCIYLCKYPVFFGLGAKNVFRQPHFRLELCISLFHRSVHVRNDLIDRSKVPQLNEDDLEEWYVKGSGPGGQNVNKRTNCCCLKHKPTGLLVKCHVSRELNQNRKTARLMLIKKLDDYINGDDSVRAQKERILLKKRKSREDRQKSMQEAKNKYREMLTLEKDFSKE